MGYCGSKDGNRTSRTLHMPSTDTEIQRAYYAATAQKYDELHLEKGGAHGLALQFMMSVLEGLDVKSILDIGCGTGRALVSISNKMPNVFAVGIEPSADLRNIGYSKGLPASQLIDGDGMNLSFPDDSFDMVCEFGALHHIPEPSKVVSEMIRVSRKAIFISDSNNFGEGGAAARLAKQAIDFLGLWPFANLIKTKGKRYSISEGDGLAYSYSVFNDYKQIEKACQSVHLLSTRNGGRNLYRSASHVALLGIKHRTY